MNKLNINNLPAEILTEVFRYLNVPNSKNATMVCRRWNNLIKSAFRWSMKLEHHFGGCLFMRNNYILTTNRKFGTIEIYAGRLNEDDKTAKIIKTHGFNVVELHLRGCRIDNLTGFAKLFNFTPNLKHAFVQTMQISHGSSDVLDQLLPDLKKLKSLEFCESDLRIIKCFRKAKLTTMKITQLSISSIKPTENYDHLMRFIESQAGTLTEIELGHGISNSVFECFFANMTKLATLSVKIEDLPRDYDFYGRLKENGSVHTLRLLDFGMFDDQFVGKFLQKLPNVRCLVLRHKNILVKAQSLSKLESLHIESIHGTLLDNVKFPNLKTFYIQHLRGKINWNEFTKVHPLLTELTTVRMASYSYLTSDDIDQITTNVDLQHIRLGDGFVADTRFFEIVGSKCKNLKVLDLDKSCISQNLRHYTKVDVLRLRDRITCSKVFRSLFSS